MAYMNDADQYRRAADAVLAALRSDEVEGEGEAHPLNEVARTHAELESGNTAGTIYLET
jgi:hypothetical protein